MRLALLPALFSLLPLCGQNASEVKAFVPSLTPLKRVQPDFEEARRSGLQGGIVRLLVTVGSEGSVIGAEVLTGPEVLRSAALDAVRQWRFHPVTRNGQAVAAYTEALLVFSILGSPPSASTNRVEDIAAMMRLAELQRQFPRSPADVLADLEQDGSGAEGQLRFYLLNRLAKAAWEAQAFDKAADYARELVGMAGANETADWNFGNAIHDGNAVLGLVALRSGDLAQAARYLLDAGKTRGSPQLNSFGPNVTLAKEMLEHGERDAVLEYFAECRAFWKMGSAQLDAWTSTVRSGGTPNFGANLKY